VRLAVVNFEQLQHDFNDVHLIFTVSDATTAQLIGTCLLPLLCTRELELSYHIRQVSRTNLNRLSTRNTSAMIVSAECEDMRPKYHRRLFSSCQSRLCVSCAALRSLPRLGGPLSSLKGSLSCMYSCTSALTGTSVSAASEGRGVCKREMSLDDEFS
jgi:hypothetical protein